MARNCRAGDGADIMKFFLVPVLLGALSSVHAQTIQSLSSIEAAVKGYVGAQLAADPDTEFTLGRLDPRLRLVACGAALEMRFSHEPHGGGPNAVEVRCEGERPWSLYVTVEISRYAQVLVATRALVRGSVIAQEDVVVARRRLNGTRLDHLRDPAAAVGRVATRAIGPDQILAAANVMLPRLVKRGDEVTIASIGTAVSVQVKGQALKDGALGDRISVRNLNSKRVVEGIVNADGMVVIHAGAVL